MATQCNVYFENETRHKLEAIKHKLHFSNINITLSHLIDEYFEKYVEEGE